MSSSDRPSPPATIKLPETPVNWTQHFPAILLFGMPGVGKGTQGSLMGKMRGMFHVSTGEIFRGLDANSDDGRAVARLVDQGELVPDEMTVTIWRHWIDGQIAAGHFRPEQNEVLVLDGIPRSVEQCRLLEDHVDVLTVIHLEPPSDEPIVERLRERAIKENRADDADEVIIRKRFAIYREITEPVLGYYSAEIVHRVDPIGTPMQIKKRLLELVIPAVRSYEQAG